MGFRKIAVDVTIDIPIIDRQTTNWNASIVNDINDIARRDWTTDIFRPYREGNSCVDDWLVNLSFSFPIEIYRSSHCSLLLTPFYMRKL